MNKFDFCLFCFENNRLERNYSARSNLEEKLQMIFFSCSHLKVANAAVCKFPVSATRWFTSWDGRTQQENIMNKWSLHFFHHQTLLLRNLKDLTSHSNEVCNLILTSTPFGPIRLRERKFSIRLENSSGVSSCTVQTITSAEQNIVVGAAGWKRSLRFWNKVKPE